MTLGDGEPFGGLVDFPGRERGGVQGGAVAPLARLERGAIVEDELAEAVRKRRLPHGHCQPTLIGRAELAVERLLDARLPGRTIQVVGDPQADQRTVFEFHHGREGLIGLGHAAVGPDEHDAVGGLLEEQLPQAGRHLGTDGLQALAGEVVHGDEEHAVIFPNGRLPDPGGIERVGQDRVLIGVRCAVDEGVREALDEGIDAGGGEDLAQRGPGHLADRASDERRDEGRGFGHAEIRDAAKRITDRGQAKGIPGKRGGHALLYPLVLVSASIYPID